LSPQHTQHDQRAADESPRHPLGYCVQIADEVTLRRPRLRTQRLVEVREVDSAAMLASGARAVGGHALTISPTVGSMRRHCGPATWHETRTEKAGADILLRKPFPDPWVAGPPSAVVDPIETALLLLDVGELLDPVGLGALACSFAAFRLGVVELGLGGLGRRLLGRSDLRLFLALDRLGCFLALSRCFVGLLLGGSGALFSRLVSRAFALIGIGARVNRLLLCRVARRIQIRHHFIARGRQFGLGLLSIPSGGRVKLGGLAERGDLILKRNTAEGISAIFINNSHFSSRGSGQVGFVGQFVGLPPDASGLGVGRGGRLHRAFMFCRGIDGFLCCGTDLFALFCFRPMYLVLRVELGPSFRSYSVLLGVPLSLALLSGLLLSHRGLYGCCFGGHCNSLLGTCDPGVCCFDTGLRRLGVGNGFDAVRLLALLGLGLLELPLGGQRVVAGHSADDFLRLSLDRVDQAFTCLFGLFVLRH
jgi:hypothetical protein